MIIKDIIKIFEAEFPNEYAFDGDNVGLLIGDEAADVTKVLATCDVDIGVVREAIACGANLIVSHHPLMFHKTNRLTESNPEQSAIRLMISNGISHYAAHTNLDTAPGGLNDLMASLLGMEDTTVAEPEGEDDRGVHGYGRICTLKESLTLKELMDRVISVFGADGLRYTGSLDDKVTKLAVNTGGGAGIIDTCIAAGCDTLITGDVKYNAYRDARENGMNIVDIMHFDSEHIAMDLFESWFARKLPELEVIKSRANTNMIKSYSV